MKILFTLFLTFLYYLPILSQETFPVNGVAKNFEPIYAFTNAHIVIDPNNKLSNGTLLIQGNKIIDIGTATFIPKGAIIYDLNGDFIYPSFIDLYTKYGLPKTKKKGAHYYNPQYKSKKDGAFHWNEAIHPEVNSHDQFTNNTTAAIPYLKNGFGLVLTHAQDGILRGTGCLVSLSKKTEQENIILQEAASFLSFKKGTSTQKNPTSLMGSIALIRQTFLDAEWYRQQNEQTNLSYDAFNNQRNLPHIFIINNELDYSRVYKIANEFEIDFIVKGNGKEYSRIKDLANSKSPIIIPLNFPNAYDISDPEKAEWVSLNKLKDWETAPFNPAILEKNNITFCITSANIDKEDTFLSNLRLAVKNGLSKQRALASLTTVPAEVLKMENSIGSLSKGKLANFFIASKDIFENGEIYENWTAGERHIINTGKNIDVRGYYNFKNSEFKNSLVSIQGSKDKPEAIIYALDSLPLKTKLKGDNIIINNTNGTFRFSGKFRDDKIIGRYQDSIGLYYLIKMQRDSLYSENTTPFKLEMPHSFPSIWLPNKSYGFEEFPQHKNIIFRNATVWTNEKEGILPNTDVAIQNGKIIAIGNQLNELEIFPKTIKITQINATNKHLTCGIIDEHSHIAISKGVNEASQSVTAEVRIGDVINPTDRNIYRQLAGGVTTSQLLHGSANPIGGQSAIIKLRWGSSAEEMKVENAAPFIKFALGENVKQSNWGDFERIRFPQTRMGVEQVFYDAFYRAKEYQKSWDKFNQLPKREKRKKTPPREDLELNSLVEILNSERFITCHSYIQSEINMLMHVGDSMGFTVNTFTHILEGYKLAEKMRKHGAGGSTFSDWWAYKFEVNDAIPYNAALLNNAGVLTAINSDDAEMGRRLNQEAAKAIKYGDCSEEEAWKMVTLNPAKLLHLDKRMGSVKIGKDADIVLWTGNPLSIYSKVIQTYVDGKLMFDIQNDKKLRERDRLERMRIIQKMSANKDTGPKQNPQPIKEKLYHCDTKHDE